MHIHLGGLFATWIVVKGDTQAMDGRKDIKLNRAETAKLQFGDSTGKDGFFSSNFKSGLYVRLLQVL